MYVYLDIDMQTFFCAAGSIAKVGQEIQEFGRPDVICILAKKHICIYTITKCRFISHTS